MRMFKAAIFDMDGLLINSEPFWRSAHIEILGNYGLVVSEDDVRQMAGRRTADVVALWQERFDWQEVSGDQLTSEIVLHVTESVRLHGSALPGVHALIEILERHHIPLAVASSSTLEMITAVLDKLELRDKFQVIHSAEHEKHGKPFPDVFLATAKSLRSRPSECVVFEDSPNGVKAAEAAGMKCVAVPEEPFEPADFAIADLVVSNLEEVNWAALKNLF